MTFKLDDIREQLQWRYATKVFDKNKKIPQDQWSLLEESLVLSPSSYGLQPWKFLIVENKDIREQLKGAAWNQGQVTDASHFVVLTTLKKIDEDYVKKFIKSNAEARAVPVESLVGFENMLLKNVVSGLEPSYVKTWNQRQAYIAMGFFMQTAAMLKVDTLAMEGLDPAKFDKILGIENSDYGTVAAIAAGYRDVSDKYQHAKKVRFSKAEVIKHVL